MKFNGEIPGQLNHLERDERNYPIPYFVAYVGERPDFRLADSLKQVVCLKHSKCWVCGKKLTKGSYWFIGGILTLKNRVATDTAMHEHCARFSLEACPHMKYEKADRRETGEIYQGAKEANTVLHLDKPKEIFLIFSETYQNFQHPQAQGYLVRFQPKKVYTFHYVDGILIEKK